MTPRVLILNPRRVGRAGFFFFLAGNALLTVFLTLSHIYATRFGYRSSYWELSELVYYGNQAKGFFMAAIIIEAFSLFGVLVPLGFFISEKKWRVGYYFLVCLTTYSLLLVGAVPEDWFYLGHYLIAIIFFFAEGALILFTSIYLFKLKTTINRFYPWFGLFTFGAFIFYIITRDLFGNAYTQRIVVLLSILFVLVLGAEFLLREKHYSRLN